VISSAIFVDVFQSRTKGGNTGRTLGIVGSCSGSCPSGSANRRGLLCIGSAWNGD